MKSSTTNPTPVRTEPLEPRTLCAAGDLDPSFDGDGRLVSDVRPSDAGDVRHRVAAQPDGKVVMAIGSYAGPSRSVVTVLRLEPDGTPDESFGVGGRVVTTFAREGQVTFDIVRDLLVLPGGDILVAGSAHSAAASFQSFAALRLNPDGSPDEQFGGDGKFLSPISAAAFAAAVQSGGKLVLAGHTINGNARHFHVERVLDDGTLDTDFGTGGGGVTTTFLAASDSTAYDVVIDPDDKILVTGRAIAAPVPNGPWDRGGGMIRLLPDGRYDPSFDGDGELFMELPPLGDLYGFASVALQAGGRFVTVDNSILGGRGKDIFFRQFNADGSPTGVVTRVDYGFADDLAYDLAAQPDGKLVAVGSATSRPGKFDFAAVRVNPDLTPDDSFGPASDGKVAVDFGKTELATAAAIDADGRILVSGSTLNTFGSASDVRLAVARLHSGLPPVVVTGRHVFYNNSSFDNNDPAFTAADAAAIATDKFPLLPGHAAQFFNYTSYSKGINGVMVDLERVDPGAVTADDFAFRVGNDDGPAGWAAAPDPVITSLPGPGGADAARVALAWPEGAIKGTWLQVTVKANETTALAADDVFYFGNAPGESGNWPTAALVNSVDEAAARHRPRGASNPAPITFRWDYNRDGRVNRLDQLVVRANRTTAETALQLINVPAGGLGLGHAVAPAVRPVVTAHWNCGLIPARANPHESDDRHVWDSLSEAAGGPLTVCPAR